MTFCYILLSMGNCNMTNSFLKQWPCDFTLDSLGNKLGSSITQQEGPDLELVVSFPLSIGAELEDRIPR